MREYLLVLLVTAAVTFVLTPLVRRVAVATRAIHAPRARDTHTEPTPLLGGLAMYGGLVAGLIVASRLTSLQDPFRRRVEDRGRVAAGRRARGRGRVHRRPVGPQRDQQAGRAGGGGRHPGLERAVAALAADAQRWRVLAGTGPEPDAHHPARRDHDQRDQLHRRPGRPGRGHRGRRRAVVPGLLVHAHQDDREFLAVAARGVLGAAGRNVPGVPAAQLLPGPDLHGRHRRHAARPDAGLRADLEHRVARPRPADQLRPEPRR